PDKIMKYDLGSGKSTLVYEEKDEAYTCGVSINKDFGYILIGSHSSLTTEYRIKRADDDNPFEVFLEREEGHEYYPELDGEKVLIKTNKDAENFRMMECTVSDRKFSSWKIIQEHSKDVYIEDFEVFRDHYVILEKINGLTQIRVYDLKTGDSKVV